MTNPTTSPIITAFVARRCEGDVVRFTIDIPRDLADQYGTATTYAGVSEVWAREVYETLGYSIDTAKHIVVTARALLGSALDGVQA